MIVSELLIDFVLKIVCGRRNRDSRLPSKEKFLLEMDNPKSRPSMATIVNMLKGDTDVDEMKISKLGLLSQLSRTYRSTPNESFLISQRNNVLWHHNFHFHIRENTKSSK